MNFTWALPMYGTAWKKEATTELVKMAVRAGFRAIDTANQPKHYSEALVGQALSDLEEEGFKRSDLFIQTKFTPLDGQDPKRIPYDPKASISEQVAESFLSTLKNLKTKSVDSYLLHGPYSRFGLTEEDHEAWEAIELISKSGKAKSIGISNVNLGQLQLLCKNAKIKPEFVQNRCYAETGWDFEIRAFCLKNEIRYQGFSLLTANQQYLNHPVLQTIAETKKHEVAQVVFRFALQVGMIPLTGTTDPLHMKLDLDLSDFTLDDEDIKKIEQISI